MTDYIKVGTSVTVNNVELFVAAMSVGGKIVVNLNKHDIVLHVSGEDIVFPASGVVCTVSVKQVEVSTLVGAPVMSNEYGEVENLPDPQQDMVFIVNALVLSRVNRDDCVGPDTGPSAIRENGQVKKVVRFVR